jgi:CHAT domain-containing protein
VHDVTTTRPAPRAAVLAGCRTGALELDSGQTSLALAFLAAGAEQVIASAEAVEDARGARLAQALYAALGQEPGAALDLPRAMQQAQRELWAAGEEPAGYRVWVR